MRIVSKYLLIMILLGLVSCNKLVPENYKIDKLSGLVQKGPYVIGTAISVSEINSDLNPTGKIFSSQIEDNYGSFELNDLSLNSPYLEIRADGFYFDEILGETSAAQLTLFCLANVSEQNTINVNIMTQLEKKRVEYLFHNSLSFKEAKEQAQMEIMAMFSIEYDKMSNSELLDITKKDEKNAVLLAISLILQVNRSVGDLTELLATINLDLEEDGILSNEDIKTDLLIQAASLDLSSVRANLENRYSSLGVNAEIPNFEKYLTAFLGDTDFLSATFSTKNVTCHNFSTGEIDMTIEGGITPYSFDWSNGESTEDLTDLPAGLYSVTIVDAVNNKKTYSDILIEEPDSLIITLKDIVYMTDGIQAGSIDISVSGGTTPYSYLWSSGENTEDILGLEVPKAYEISLLDANSCKKSEVYLMYETFFDLRDGNEYRSIGIGNQIWMGENLAWLPQVDSFTDESYSESRYYVYDYNGTNVNEAKSTGNYDTLGVLYNWTAALSSCPEGWHQSSDEEWKQLEMYLGMSRSDADDVRNRGSNEGDKLKLSTGWLRNNKGNNESGFSAQAGGKHEGTSIHKGNFAYWWTSTDPLPDSAYSRILYTTLSAIDRSPQDKREGQSVRCIKD